MDLTYHSYDLIYLHLGPRIVINRAVKAKKKKKVLS